MKALLMTMGTRGDVQPFLALAQGLRAAGHEAVVVAPHRFADFAAAHGVTFAGVDDGPMALMDGENAGALLEGGIGTRLELMRTLPAMFTRVLADCWSVARDSGADMVVHNGQIVAGQHVAEALGLPAVLALPIPMYVPTREFPWPGVELPARLPAGLNRATFAGMKSTALMFSGGIDRWRRDALGLSRRRGRHDPMRRPDGGRAPVLHAYSPAVLPRPADWPPEAETTGYWELAGEPVPLPEDLRRFIADGTPPVFVGFGSMAGTDPARTTRTVLEAARRAGRRLVVGAGWGGLDVHDLPEDVFAVTDVDYRSLFPHMAAIVHHGGAGTTGVAFAAGRPQLVCPFVADQPFWGRLVQRLGVGPAPQPQKRLEPAALAAALTQLVDSPDLGRTARRVGEQVRAEDGVGTAVHALERLGRQRV
jgi:sterol 3beta-glucosyltransferase